ncbi:MAG: esterase-like activity of phytase family protein [Capsulimonas sp.]|uniref:esterase-like activity of phytase family protein n=1 Tax=Capsulimonas sp. TaxID=2494211 RepID=UPI003264E938
MRNIDPSFVRTSIGFVALSAFLALAQPSQAAITFLGTGSISGSATDKSGLTGTYTPGGTDYKAQLGAFGSGLAYTGFGNRYVAVNDRGFADGTVQYEDRLQLIDIKVNANTGTVTPTLVNTILLHDETGRQFTGFSGAIDPTNGANSLRFDPEAVRVTRDGNIFVSDEYGPSIYEFDSTGKRIKTITLPAAFGIANPNADGALELSGNNSGRQANRGMEGLAISPNGKKIYGIMQNALIQDNALDGSLKRSGSNNRIFVYDIDTDTYKEFVYQLDDKDYGVNEIVAVNDHEFLVIERDGKAGASAGFKKIYKIDITGATDVSNVASLPKKSLAGTGIVPVTKSVFIDLLKPSYGLAGSSFPEKIEGLSFGPDLANGKHQLFVTNDNDLIPSQASNFYDFTFDNTDLNYQAQQVDVNFAVPEPGGIAALVMGAFGLGLLGLRRKRSA